MTDLAADYQGSTAGQPRQLDAVAAPRSSSLWAFPPVCPVPSHHLFLFRSRCSAWPLQPACLPPPSPRS